MVIFPENEDEERFPTLDNAAETCYMRYLTPIFPVSFSADRNRAARFAKHDSFPRRESTLSFYSFRGRRLLCEISHRVFCIV